MKFWKIKPTKMQIQNQFHLENTNSYFASRDQGQRKAICMVKASNSWWSLATSSRSLLFIVTSSPAATLDIWQMMMLQLGSRSTWWGTMSCTWGASLRLIMPPGIMSRKEHWVVAGCSCLPELGFVRFMWFPRTRTLIRTMLGSSNSGSGSMGDGGGGGGLVHSSHGAEVPCLQRIIFWRVMLVLAKKLLEDLTSIFMMRWWKL